MDNKEKALLCHKEWNGKLETIAKSKVNSREDLAIAYTPGVAEPCKVIAEDKSAAYTYTWKANTVAVVSDGSAVLGLGNIGRRVADIAKCFGCRVIYFSTSGKNNQKGYNRVSFDKLLEQSDIVSVHAPLTDDTLGLMNREAFARMKPGAVFLNLGRGPIVDEAALTEALNTGRIAAAGLDVLSQEPMSEDNPLRSIKDSERLIITPHIAWASIEARTRLMEIILEQIKEFFNL